MPKIVFEGRNYECRENESVLETFLRQGIGTRFSCRRGVCHVCLLRAERGAVPPSAQAGLKPGLQRKGYFLACQCIPDADMEIARPRDADLFSPAVVYSKRLLAPDICAVLLEPATALYYHAGQFINLRRGDGLTRSYSLASLPTQDYFLELHVKRRRNGVMSNWIFDELQVNDEVEIQGPEGGCYYVPGCLDQDLLLIGTGTGLAPLAGIARDALYSGHQGRIHLYHGSRREAGIYLRDTLRELSACHRNFRYTACLSGREVPAGYARGRADQVAFAEHPDLAGWRVYLCGAPGMVHAAGPRAHAAGAQPAEIHADPFEPADRGRGPRAIVYPFAAGVDDGQPPDPAPDPEMWAALDDGRLMHPILKDFYDRVYADPLLSPFFANVTKQRLIEKQFLFMRQLFTGERVYFGDRPRNAHHWMVISGELFDHREALMEASLRRHGLPEHLVRRWRAAEERFRGDIVKAGPWGRRVGDIELPVDGFDEAILSEGTLCDGCRREIAPGERVRYHVRIGATYCPACASEAEAGRRARP